MIRVYLFILREVFRIPEEFIKPTMRIFDGMDKTQCLQYWADVTNIPKNKFIIRYNDGGTRGRTKYGMCRITVRKGSNVLKVIHSLVDQFSDEILKAT
ncbi:MAG: hypothetical protein A3A80_02810 [Candidatus Terrybacteria bacterium RIFCSPLOWO2_01_FULL_44_24]|uniref:Uncharacterized protein n=1 Tax=Candidatus Terrybacteria bacterium RIFCSPHIGHO2_01_FULL_43_35 TaxID=1802361 RepID=A0A1G2PGQ0_9BACT|nr:MAG: hypothetical protein A2828_02600 [Candidatus Terrybacteria bacterium RIFCSPHIGHO2_01_FULL_43_35]OHA50249.1 MAG: hypothetical protein A3B75_00400 [Candidatus Terrybacteria bacterium RIFCSPHIGHO2_02_FULL_43_14]OHA51000.1 MAG: hypothetical protein A3A80_02810 [Candidatus Terrybacteria bacterium RIFCSPLOWO2_01_FULL_44_24]